MLTQSMVEKRLRSNTLSSSANGKDGTHQSQTKTTKNGYEKKIDTVKINNEKMGSDKTPPWLAAQQQRLEKFGIERCVDIHCHILPGLDDGPRDLSQSLALCAQLAEDGITTVFATSHQLGRYDRLNSAEVIQHEIDELITTLKAEQIPLEIFPGGDVRIDERLAKLLDNGEVISLANAGKHLLLELPHELFVDPTATIEMLNKRGLQTIMTHPERHPYLIGKDDLLRSWVQQGAVIQLTAGSLLGDFGRRAYNQSWRILQLGLASLVATDSHDVVRRPPRLSEALEKLTRQLGAKAARTLCIDNPLSVMYGKTITKPLPMPTDA